jgi:N-acetylglucosamine malate deacetylase 2
MTGPLPRLDALPAASAALAVYAHPDDETFGLGGALAALVDAGTAVEGLCFTRGEASTLGQPSDLAALGDVRAAELADATRVLGLRGHELLAYPDGRLAEVPVGDLASHVVAAARRQRSDLLVVFDDSGVTGHPDHQQATRAAVTAGDHLDLPVLAWTVREPVAAALNTEFGTDFRGRGAVEIDLTITVDRDRQRRAIACHRSQSTDNSVLRHRLELTGTTEALRWLRRPGGKRARSGRVGAAQATVSGRTVGRPAAAQAS